MKLPACIGTSLLLGLVPASFAPAQPQGLSSNYSEVDANKPVVCLLPGRVRKVGGVMTYLERRKPAEIEASECEIRGGEYTLYDRANYANALAVWMEAAEQGDPTAQIYVGEIYEKGWVGDPDYATAATWYAKAAEQGDRRAQRRLAYFYENGLGVERSREQALALWRDALGLQEDLVLASEVDAAKSAAQRQIDGLLAQLERQHSRTGRLQRSLEEAQSALHEQTTALEQERGSIRRLQQGLAWERADNGDPARIRELENLLEDSKSRMEEQRVAIELLEADVAAQRAQVTASQRQAEVRGRQLARAQEQLLAESSRGDALLVQLNEQEQALAELESRLAGADAALQRSRSREEELAARLSAGTSGGDLQEELELARREVGEQEERVRAVQRELEARQSEFERQLAQSRLREGELSSALDASRREKAELARRLEASDRRMAAMDEELTRARYALADREAASEALREQLAALGENQQEARRSIREKLQAQEDEIAELRKQKAELRVGWEAMERERDQYRTQLASKVDAASWLNVELQAASGKLAATREELTRTRLAFEEANFARKQLSDEVSRLEQDLARSRERGVQVRQWMEEELRRTREMLARSQTDVDTLRQQASRLESDYELIGERQQGRLLAMRGLEEPKAPFVDVPPVAKRANYHAVIIANYDYDFLPDLSSPPFDANELKQLLEDRYGFNVEVLVNLDRSGMYKALAQVRDFGESDHVLLYYAGHGKMDEYGDGYWLPTDYHESQPLVETVSSNDLTRTLNVSRAKHIFVMADSCYSGAMARNADPVIRKSVPALLNFWMANKSRTVLTSGGLKPVLDEGPDNHSVFASALLRALQGNPGAVNGEMLHARVYELVQRQAAQLGYLDQRPRFAVIEDAGHENGQFVFLGPDVTRG